MIRLSPINPADTSKYPSGIGTFNIGAASDQSKILFYNESPYNLDLDFYNGSTDTLHAWEANYWTLDADTKQIEWIIDADSLNVVGSPISAVFMTLYGPQERIGGTYPMALVRLANVGNPQNVGGGGTGTGSTLVNTGNPTGQNVVTVNSTAATGNTWTVSNDGLWLLAVTIAAALVQVLKTNETDPILQLGQVGHSVEVLGTLKVDQLLTLAAGIAATGGVTSDTLTVSGASSLHSTTITGNLSVTGTYDATSAKKLDIGANLPNKTLGYSIDGDLCVWSSSGVYLKGNPSSYGGFNYQGDGSHTDFDIEAIGPNFSGQSSGTYNHGVTQFGSGVSPSDWFFQSYAGSPYGSQTMSFDSQNSTNVAITSGAGLHFQCRFLLL